MTWVFVLFMNSYAIEVDRFSTRAACEDKVRQYNAAAQQSGSRYLVWCEARPAKY